MTFKQKSIQNPLAKHDPILEKKLGQAKLILFIERFWPCIWPPIFVGILFVLISLTGFWQYIPNWLHKFSLAFASLAFILSFFPFLLFKFPTRRDALLYLEKKTGLKHSLLQSFDDELGQARPSKSTRQLWLAHREKIAKLFKGLRVGFPKPRVDRYDPYALRILLVLILFVGILASKESVYDRVSSAFELNASVVQSIKRVDAWVIPPEYTGKAPILIHDGSRKRDVKNTENSTDFQVPENSQLVIRNSGAHNNHQKVLMSGGDGNYRELKPAKDNSQTQLAKVSEYKVALTNPTGIKINSGTKTFFNWQFNIIEDAPPNIRLTQPVQKTARNAIRLTYHLSDDYGVVSAKAHIKSQEQNSKFDKNDPDRPIGQAPEFELVFPNAASKTYIAKTHKDLTSHPWAGLSVYLVLSALDEAGQKTETKPVSTILPERKFTKPLARALIEQRRWLVQKPHSNHGLVLRALDALTLAAEEFITDKAIYLGIRSAFWRLKHNSDRASVESVVDQLWHVAVDIEDGDLSDAERRMKLAQDKLAKALEEGASAAEIKKLLEELRRAVAEFLQAMQNNALKQKDITQNSQPNPNQKLITSNELDRMLKNIEDLAKTGARDMAARMLSQLRDVLENLKPNRQANSKAQKGMMSTLENLSKLIGRQQKLLDQTYQTRRQGRQQSGQNGQRSSSKGQKGQNGQSGDQKAQTDALRRQQNALEQMLGGIMKRMNQMGLNGGQALQQAQKAMGDAGKSLEKQKLQNATEQQTHAIDKLRKGAQTAANQLMQQLRRQAGDQRGRDPLGRPMYPNGPEFGSNKVNVPDQIDVQRAREILNELRSRFGDVRRPPIELDYLERLLKLF